MPGTRSLDWDYKTSVRQEDKHPTLNSGAWSVSKKRGLTQLRAVSRTGPGPSARAIRKRALQIEASKAKPSKAKYDKTRATTIQGEIYNLNDGNKAHPKKA